MWAKGEYQLLLFRSGLLLLLSVSLIWFSVCVFDYVMYSCLSGVHAHEYNCPWKPEERVRFPGANVKGGCVLSDLGDQQQPQVRNKSNKGSEY